MNTNNKDNELQALFSEMKSRDSAAVPSFARLSRVRARPSGPPAWVWFVPASLAVVITVVAVHRLHSLPPLSDEKTRLWAAYSTWDQPSDELMRISNGNVSNETAPDTIQSRKEIQP